LSPLIKKNIKTFFLFNIFLKGKYLTRNTKTIIVTCFQYAQSVPVQTILECSARLGLQHAQVALSSPRNLSTLCPIHCEEPVLQASALQTSLSRQDPNMGDGIPDGSPEAMDIPTGNHGVTASVGVIPTSSQCRPTGCVQTCCE
jgi:hypothetical protein